MELDAEKLIYYIESRPAIYNYTMKEHHLRDHIETLWSEIAAEMDSTVAACKNKWVILRNSYSRVVRETKKIPSGPGRCKRKKWWLADAMSFLNNFMGQQKKMDGSICQPSEDSNASIVSTEEATTNEEIIIDLEPGELMATEQYKKPKQKAEDLVVDPKIEFLKCRTNTTTSKPHEYANSLFFESLLSDVNRLPIKLQRQFKIQVMTILDEYLDSVEN